MLHRIDIKSSMVLTSISQSVKGKSHDEDVGVPDVVDQRFGPPQRGHGGQRTNRQRQTHFRDGAVQLQHRPGKGFMLKLT